MSWAFFKQSLCNWRHTGAVAPSSPYLAQRMVDAAGVAQAGAVLELGPGTGAIIDKEVSIGPNAVVGTGADFDIANQDEPERLNTGITVVGKRAVIPASARIGRNVRVCEAARPSDFRSRRVPSGGSIERRDHKPRTTARARKS